MYSTTTHVVIFLILLVVAFNLRLYDKYRLNLFKNFGVNVADVSCFVKCDFKDACLQDCIEQT